MELRIPQWEQHQVHLQLVDLQMDLHIKLKSLHQTQMVQAIIQKQRM